MMNHLDRRLFLRGTGAMLALPWLESLASANAKAPPKRLVYLYVPNGAHMPAWTPAATGDLPAELPETLRPLAPYRDYLSVLSGLTADKARSNGDGPGDHARAMATFLTGRQARKTAGADIRIGVSADQVVASKIGSQTHLPSLEIGADKGLNAGGCDSGYSCAYSANLSWRGESTPVSKETDPVAIFGRVFGTSASNDPARLANRARIVDLVTQDAKSLRSRLATDDGRKVDEYLESLRDVEKRIAKGSQPGAGQPTLPEGARAPQPNPADPTDTLRLLADMLALALRVDATRVATFALANEGSNRSYKFIEVPEGHHDLSHHGQNPEKQAKIQKINAFHTGILAHLLGRLREAREGQGCVLDNLMLVYGSGIGDGNRHNHDELPILLVGKGGGSLRPGRHVRYAAETPLANLHLSLIDRMGVTGVNSHGDSTGRLENL